MKVTHRPNITSSYWCLECIQWSTVKVFGRLSVEKLGIVVNHLWNYSYSTAQSSSSLFQRSTLSMLSMKGSVFTVFQKQKKNLIKCQLFYIRGGAVKLFPHHYFGLLRKHTVTHKESLHIISDKQKYLLCSSCTCSQTEKNWRRVTDRHP